jgi:hypothetical protein
MLFALLDFCDQLVDLSARILAAMGVQPPYPTAEQLLLWMIASTVTVISYYVFFGNRHLKRRKRLQSDLRAAQVSSLHYESLTF